MPRIHDLPREEFLLRLARSRKTEEQYFETLRRHQEALDDASPPPPDGKLTDIESFGWSPFATVEIPTPTRLDEAAAAYVRAFGHVPLSAAIGDDAIACALEAAVRTGVPIGQDFES